jgi:hypothetical protein
MNKRLFMLLFAAIAVFIAAEAQHYVVYAVSGKPELVMPTGKKAPLKLRENLSASDVINIPYGATLELIDTDSRKQYTLRQPGKGKLESMMADRRNSVLKLTSQYFDYVIAQVKGSGQVVTRRVSDPATVTREVAIDSMYVKEIDNDSILKKADNDSNSKNQ